MELEKKNDNITYELGGELVFTVMLIWRQVHVIIAMFLPRKDVELLERPTYQISASFYALNWSFLVPPSQRGRVKYQV